MSKQQKIISVCIITYKRPEQLRILLESLSSQTFLAQHKVEIIVVDNDSQGSAKEVVNGFMIAHPHIDLIYAVEPQQGIPLARNRSVKLAHGKFAAFIDDDEKADPQWLEALYKSLILYKADAVFGPVEPLLPSDTPAWLQKGGFYDRPHHKDGTPVSTGRTSNALVLKSWLDRYENPFDPKLRFTGGSDSDFVVRILKQGAKLCWAEYAQVYEFIGKERLKLKWLLMRAFRGGQGHAWRHAKNKTPFEKILHIIFRTLLCFVSLLMILPSLILGRHQSVWWMRKLFSNMGQLCAFLPFKYEEYKNSNYR